MIRLLVSILAIVQLAAASAQSEPRIALIVGNANYRSVEPLDNAVNDAKLIATRLTGTGFEVIYLPDADLVSFKGAISAFGRRLREAGPAATGLFYYAGHGVQSFGTNYLLPVDTFLTDAADLPLVAVEADSVLRQMFSAKNRTNIVILDACRNNPFVGVPNFTNDGLAEMSAPTGSFVAFATAPGDVAYDGAGENSAYTKALAELLSAPGLAIEQLFKQVRVRVLADTGGKQTPWDTSSLTGNFEFVPDRAAPAAVRDTEEELWDAVRTTRDPVQIVLFLRAYPDSRFAAAARTLLAEVAVGGPPETPAPQTRIPDDRERKLIQQAQSEGTIAAYRAYLAAFPNGVFATLAQTEMAALDTSKDKDPVGDGLTPAPPAGKTEIPPAADGEVVTFLDPISDPGGAADGRSLAELVRGSPAFAPFEGLPIEAWKGKSCAGCHDWDRAKLCEQATTYATRGVGGVERIQHPYGGGFKRALANWARHDCQ